MPQSSLQTPIGTIRISAEGGWLTSIAIGAPGPDAWIDADDLTREAAAQIAAWFEGARPDFALPLLPARSPRGNVLRAALQAVPYGRTASYGEVARSIGSGARAVGQACARNPFPIIVPCHRILGANGAIGHYSAGEGIITKRRLLDHERKGTG